MADVHHHSRSINEYALYHPALPSTADYLKKSFVVSEIELLPLGDDDSAAIPRTLPSELEVDAFSQKRHEGVVTGGEVEVNFGQHLVVKDQLEPVQDQDQDQDQDQGQEQLTLLTSINEQTTSLLASCSQLDPQNGQNGEDDTSLLEQALVLGQISLVLASSLPAVAASGNSSVGWSLDTSQAQAQDKEQSRALGVQAQVVVALANMGTALVKQFDRTGDRRDLEEAGRVYERAVVVGRGRWKGMGKRKGEGETQRVKQRVKQRVSEWDRQEDEDEDGGEDGRGNGHGEILVRLEKLRVVGRARVCGVDVGSCEL